MAQQILDGTGKGYWAKVDEKFRLHTYSVIEDESFFINRVEKEMYSGSWGSGVIASSPGNFIFYLRNTSSIKDIVITRIKHRCTEGNGSLSFILSVQGTPGGTLTTLVPANRNAISNNEADCEYYSSPNITGLSEGRTVGSSYGKQDDIFIDSSPCSGYILPPNGTLAVKADNSTAKHYGGFGFYFRDSVN